MRIHLYHCTACQPDGHSNGFDKEKVQSIVPLSYDEPMLCTDCDAELNLVRNAFDDSAVSREGITDLEVSRTIRSELLRLLSDLMEQKISLSDPATQQRISDAEYSLGLYSDYLGDTLPGPKAGPEDAEDDGFSYDDDNAHAPVNADSDPRLVRLS